MFLSLIQLCSSAIPLICVYLYIKEHSKLKEHYAEKERSLDKDVKTIKIDPDESKEILFDIQQKGFSIIRIDSNDIFYRSPKG